MEKIESIAGTKIKFFNAPDFNEVEDLVNKWIDENSKSHQYIYDIQYKHNMVLEQEDALVDDTPYKHNVSVMIVYGIE